MTMHCQNKLLLVYITPPHYKLATGRISDFLPKNVQNYYLFYFYFGLFRPKYVTKKFFQIFLGTIAQCVRCDCWRKFDSNLKEIKISALFQIVPTHMCCAVVKGLIKDICLFRFLKGSHVNPLMPSSCFLNIVWAV